MSNTSFFISIVVTGFTVAFFHAAIPTHWLPFVLASRVQKWTRMRTLWVAILAGGGHVLITTLLGVLIVFFGIKLDESIGRWFPLVAGLVLIAFGAFYLYRQKKGLGHGHAFGGHEHKASVIRGEHGGQFVEVGHELIEISVFEENVPPRFRLYFYSESGKPLNSPSDKKIELETVRPSGERELFKFMLVDNYFEAETFLPEPHEFKAILETSHGDHSHSHEVEFIEDHLHHHGHGHSHANSGKTSDSVAIMGLIALLTFSPCEGFLPVYFSGIEYGWFGFFVLSAILAGATLLGMVTFTWLTLAGIEKFKFQWLEKYESGLMGGILCALGLLIIIFEH